MRLCADLACSKENRSLIPAPEVLSKALRACHRAVQHAFPWHENPQQESRSEGTRRLTRLPIGGSDGHATPHPSPLCDTASPSPISHAARTSATMCNYGSKLNLSPLTCIAIECTNREFKVSHEKLHGASWASY